MTLFDVYPLYDITPTRGEGCYVYDDTGQAYLDFYGGHAVISIGHAHPHFTQSVERQLRLLPFYSNSVRNPLQVELARKLGALSGCEDYRLFLCNSGAEANENALKLASFHNGRKKILAFRRAFHGRTSAAVNVTDNPGIKAPINTSFEVIFHEWNDLPSAQRSLENDDICAVIIEGIQGIGGIHVPEVDFLRALSALCHATGAVLILDEIQSGYGRSGHFFAFQKAGIHPDLITAAKGMGNGFPIGGVLIHPRFEARRGLLGTTFGGSHLASAAGIAVLEVIERENLVANAAEQGQALFRALAGLDGLVETRGAGLMIGLQFDFPAAALRESLLFDGKVFTGSASDPHIIRLLPPLNIGGREVDIFVEKLKQALRTAHSVAPRRNPSFP
jgi:acetylornithine/N-succinyldiaminopimelate aminotransferase